LRNARYNKIKISLEFKNETKDIIYSKNFVEIILLKAFYVYLLF